VCGSDDVLKRFIYVCENSEIGLTVAAFLTPLNEGIFIARRIAERTRPDGSDKFAS
jgi:hypothetical protein